MTVGEYLAFADATKSNYPIWLEAGNRYHIETGTDSYYKDIGYNRKASRLPVVGVSWHNAKAYAEWLSEKTGQIYRLPTEAEWEYAARGGQKSKGYKYAGSNDPDDVAWYSENANGKPHEVGTNANGANELGLYDMSGNVWEWCHDWYGDYTKNSTPAQNPTGPEKGVFRVLRGGSWRVGPASLRCSDRNYDRPF